MRAFKRVKDRGFTLVELMIVVAIIGVLASLAIFGVKKYLASAKSAEAKNTIGAIQRAAVAAYERENMGSELVVGSSSSGASHALCDTADPVPSAAASIDNKKYTADTAEGKDYNVGTQTSGWKCLKFQMNEAQYYQYAYTKGAKTITNIATPAVPATGWASEAVGNLDGDTLYSGFLLAGDIIDGQPITSTAIAEENPDELSRASALGTRRRLGSHRGAFGALSASMPAPRVLGSAPMFERSLTYTEVAVAIALVGTMAVIAIPSFAQNLQASRMTEAAQGVRTIATSAAARAEGRLVEEAFPPPAPLTPSVVPRGDRVVDPPDTWEHLTWKSLDFKIDHDHYFSFAFDSQNDPNRSTCTARAHGDLDGDGERSTFEVLCEATAKGPRVLPGLYVDREVE